MEKIIGTQYKQIFGNPSQPRLGVLLDQGTLVTDCHKKADILFRDCFSGQHLRNSAFNEQFRQDVLDQVNVISMYEQHNDSFCDITDYELEKALGELSIDGKSTDPDELHPVDTSVQ